VKAESSTWKAESEKEVAWRAILYVTGDGVSGGKAEIKDMLPGRQYNKGERAKPKANS